jgi:hypothetical protein
MPFLRSEMRELNGLEDLESWLSSSSVPENERKAVVIAADNAATKKAVDVVIPNIYAKAILVVFITINMFVVVLIGAAFFADIGLLGTQKGGDRFINANVIMALITGVTVQVSYAVKTITEYFFKAREEIQRPQTPTPRAPQSAAGQMTTEP